MFPPSLDRSIGVLRDAFARDGALFLPSLVTPEGARALARTVRAIAGGADLPGADRESDDLFDLARVSPIARLAQALLGGAMVALAVDVHARGAATSAPVRDRRDYEEHFGDERALTVFVALDPMEVTAGAPEIALGSHARVAPIAGAEPFTGRALAPGDGVVWSADALRRGRDPSRARAAALAFRYRASPHRLATRAVSLPSPREEGSP